MKNKKGKYEIMVVAKSMLPDNVRIALEEKVIQLIKEGEGTVVSTDTLGKRYLAYKIKNHTEGYFLLYNVELPSSSLPNLNASLRLMSQILRFLILKK
jgi:small subunit ribosomal protein S6